MFDQYYGFSGRPFQLTPDPAFYFESITHRKALSYLGYGMAQGEGFIVITGEIGAGTQVIAGPGERQQAIAGRGDLAGDEATDKAGGAGQGDFHVGAGRPARSGTGPSPA